VPYTEDDTWFYDIKDVIERLQYQPTWLGLSQSDIDAAAAAESKKYLPSMPVVAASRSGRSAAPGVRMSRTTDDIPDVTITKPLRTEPPPTAAAAKAAPSKEAAVPASRPTNLATPVTHDSGGARTPPAQPQQAARTVAKSRGQSTSSLDKSLTSERSQNARPNPPTVNH